MLKIHCFQFLTCKVWLLDLTSNLKTSYQGLSLFTIFWHLDQTVIWDLFLLHIIMSSILYTGIYDETTSGHSVRVWRCHLLCKRWCFQCCCISYWSPKEVDKDHRWLLLKNVSRRTKKKRSKLREDFPKIANVKHTCASKSHQRR